MLIRASLSRHANASHLNGLQLGQHLLPLLVHLPQVFPHMLHHLLHSSKLVLQTGPLGLGHLVQQRLGLLRLLVLLQNAGENVSVDLQSGAHQPHVTVTLEVINEGKRRLS